jgi:hypothetical protein
MSSKRKAEEETPVVKKTKATEEVEEEDLGEEEDDLGEEEEVVDEEEEEDLGNYLFLWLNYVLYNFMNRECSQYPADLISYQNDNYLFTRLYLGTFKIFIFVDSCKLPLIFK